MSGKTDMWPIVPDHLRPKDLPHNGMFNEEESAALGEKGWNPVDVRLEDGQRAVKLWLEGLRLGTLEADKQKLSVLELEARIYGLSGAKRFDEPERKTLTDGTLEDIMGHFDGKAAYRTDTGLQDPATIPKKKGRKKGSVDKQPRTLGGAAKQSVLKARERGAK